MAYSNTKSNAEHIQKRCFDLLVWTLQHFTPKLQHFFLTQNRSFNPFSDEVRFWDTGYKLNADTKECAEKIKKYIYEYWQENYQNCSNHHQTFTELATQLLDPTSPLSKALKIGNSQGTDEAFGFHIELVGRAVGHIISSEALSNNNGRENKFKFQDILELAINDNNPDPTLYKKLSGSNLIAVLNYAVQNQEITKENIYIYLAEYTYARLSSFTKNLPKAFIPILLPLRGLGQWRAMAGWICPKNRQLKQHLKLIRKAQPESLILAIEEIYSVNLIDSFIFLLEEVLSKVTDSMERTRKASEAFSQLWIADEIRFFRENSLILSLSINEEKQNSKLQLGLSADITEKTKLLVVDEETEGNSTITFNLNKHKDGYLLRRALGFDLIVYKNCYQLKLNLPGQEEYWEAQLNEKLSHTAAIIIKEQYLLTQGLTHEIMNTLSRRSRYRVLYARALNDEPIDKSEILYTCSVLQELYYLTDAIRTVTKFDDPKVYLMKLASDVTFFDLEQFALAWRETIQSFVQQLLFGISPTNFIAVVFHRANCIDNANCDCELLAPSNIFTQLPTFAPFTAEATSLFLVGIHEILGNAIQYLTKQKSSKGSFLSTSLADYQINIEFSLVQGEDQFYELKISNPVNKDEKPTELSDGLKRTQNLLSCFVFQDKKGDSKKLVEFCLVEASNPNYHCVSVRFRPHIVFQGLEK